MVADADNQVRLLVHATFDQLVVAWAALEESSTEMATPAEPRPQRQDVVVVHVRALVVRFRDAVAVL